MREYEETDFMSKQFKSLSICTKAFMTEDELALNNEKTRLTVLHKKYVTSAKAFEKYINEQVDDYDYHEEIHQRLSMDKFESATSDYYNKMKSKISEIKKELQNKLDSNIGLTRTLNLENYTLNTDNFDENKMIKYMSINLFENTLSRALSIETNTFTDNIITIRTYHNSILKSLIDNGFYWNDNKYILYTCGAGALRTRKSVWIREDSYNKIENKMFNGLTIQKINEHGGHYSNKILAYRALPLSSTVVCDFIDIQRVAVVDDITNIVVADVDKVNTQSMADKRKEKEYVDKINLIVNDMNRTKEKISVLKEFIDDKNNTNEDKKPYRKERTSLNKLLQDLRNEKKLLTEEAKKWKFEEAKKWDTIETIKNCKNEIALADGIGMIRPTIKLEDGTKYKTKNCVIRAPWMKGLLGVFDFEKFIDTYERNEQTYVSKENGKTYKLKKYECLDVWGDVFNIKDVDVILTASQLKTWNFYDSMQDYVDGFIENECELSIASMEAEELSNHKKITYQMIQSLACCSSIENVKDIANTAIDNITQFGKNEETMLHIMGADKPYTSMNWFQRSLCKYPELLKDKGIKKQMKQTKEKLINELIGGHFELGNAYYPYLIPDLFAVCQILFNVTPKDGIYGLLKGDEVYCSLFEDNEEVIVDRNPALYFEHFYTVNKEKSKVKDWFKTKAIYCSANSMMTMVLCNDYDGDTGLISNNKYYVECVKRHLAKYQRNSLAYNLQKADKTIIDNETMFKGITSAYNANIGEISNRITILWNSLTEDSSEISKQLVLYCIKIECAYNNQTIDFAKNLFLSEKTNKLKKVEEIVMNKLSDVLVDLLDYKESTIDKLIEIIDSGEAHKILKDNNYKILPVPSIKVPHFFTHIKNYSLERVSEKNGSLVNELTEIAPSEKIFFDDCVKGNFKWKMLLPKGINVKSIPNDKSLIEKFNYLHKYKKKLFERISNEEKYKDITVNSYIIDELIKSLEIKSNDRIENINTICNILVKYIYTHNHEDRMNTIWNCMGRVLYYNLKDNLKNTKRCEVCGNRFELNKKSCKPTKYCIKCAKKIKLEKVAKLKRDKRNL